MIKLIKEGISKPFVDWNALINIKNNGINRKVAADFSKTYRLNQDFDLGPVEEIYKWGIEDNFLADLIENKGFWTDEQGNVAIPKGTEFTFYFYPDDDGRQLYIYFLNVPELEKDPEQWWTDRYYNDDE